MYNLMIFGVATGGGGGGMWFGQDYFTHFEPSQSLDWWKWEIPEKNHLTTCKQNLFMNM